MDKSENMATDWISISERQRKNLAVVVVFVSSLLVTEILNQNTY